MSNLGIFLRGKYVDSKVVQPNKTKDYKELQVALDIGDLQNLIITANPSYKLEAKKGEVVELPIGAVSRSWDNETKKINYNQVKYYIKAKS